MEIDNGGATEIDHENYSDLIIKKMSTTNDNNDILSYYRCY
jgi:hypothetical protein